MKKTRSIRRSKEAWYHYYKVYKASGLSKRKFCEAHSLVYRTFKPWERKFRTEIRTTIKESKFIPIEVQAEDTLGNLTTDQNYKFNSRYSVKLSGGYAIEFYEGSSIQDLKKMLEVLKDVH